MIKKLFFALIFSFFVFFGNVVFSGNIVEHINPVHEVQAIELNFGEVAQDQNIPGTADYDPEDGEAGFAALLSRLLSIVVAIAAILLLIFLLWGGVEWIASGGDKSKVEKARNRITQAIVGMIVLATTIAIFMFIQSILNIELFTFSEQSSTGGTTGTTGTGTTTGGNTGTGGSPGGGNLPAP
jgi:uncharacterized membrane protein YgcG